jgi:hypothetical protein
LSWTDNSANESGFKIERALSGAGPWIQIAALQANITTYSNTGLLSGTAYYYRVRAYNAAGQSGWSNQVSATTGYVLRIDSIIPGAGTVNLPITIIGKNFGNRNSSCKVQFTGAAGTKDAAIISWVNNPVTNMTVVRCKVPQLSPGRYSVIVKNSTGQSSGDKTFSIR